MKKTWIVIGIILFLVVVTGASCVGRYNSLVTLNESVTTAWAQVENVLQRRYDLIPNLVNTVKGFAQQEQDVFVKVTQARAGLAGAIQGGKMTEMADANQALTGALSRLMVTVEAYPQLKSDKNFLQLQDELTGTENRISVARKDYNEVVGTYNAYIRRFPQVLTAKVTGAKARDYFEVTNAAAREAPTVDFTKKP